MNERIRLLAEQAEGTKKHVPAVWQFYDHELEKFAELIVRECINISQDRAAFDWAPPNDVNHIIDEIKEHFGVAE